MTNGDDAAFVPATLGPSAGDGRQDRSAADIEALMKAIREIAQAIDTRSKAVSRASGLTIPQIVVLGAVRAQGEVTTSSLSRHCDLTPATVVSILEKLEERGFVERYRNVTDRRIVHTRLTPLGDRALAEAPTLLPGPALAALAGLDPERRAALVEAFRTVAGMLRQHPEEPAAGG